MNGSLLIYNARLVDEATDSPGALLISGGRIQTVFIGDFSNRGKAVGCCKDGTAALYDACGLSLMPAFIDMHVHFRYPGLTEKEDLDTGLHAAVAGGYGTVVAMPNTKPVISFSAQVAEVEKKAAEYGLAHLFQSASITNGFSGTDISHLDTLNAEQVPVITEDGRDVANAAVMLAAMQKAAGKGIIVSCHCEDPSLAAAARPYREKALGLMHRYGVPVKCGDSCGVPLPASVDAEINDALSEANRLLKLAEDTATERNLILAQTAGCRIHIAHVSTEGSIEAVRRAKTARPAGMVTCEVTPHHLALCGTGVPGLRAFVNPPLRSEKDRLALLTALADGTADVISTDHAPHTVSDKAAGAPGFSGLETAFAVCHTILAVRNKFSISQLSTLMSARAARLLHLNRGRLLPGYDADLILVSPGEKWKVESSVFASKGKATPFEGSVLEGKVRMTIVHGEKVYGAGVL